MPPRVDFYVSEAAGADVRLRLACRVAEKAYLARQKVVVLLDDASVADSASDFLWATFTRFEPAGDIYASSYEVNRHHLAYRPPVVVDARMKPTYPKELFPDPEVVARVDRRWKEYFPEA